MLRLWRILLPTLLLLTTLLLVRPTPASAGSTKTYYQTLELDPKDATPTTIKKAYRRLALKYHPDKNRDPSAPDLFRAVSEAYEVLHDPDQKKEYDRILKYGGGGGTTGGRTSGGGYGGNGQQQQQYSHQHDANFESQWQQPCCSCSCSSTPSTHRDPFVQFNDLFRNTFRDFDAAEGLNDLFRNTFRDFDAGGAAGAGGGGHREQQAARRGGQGWGAWIVDKLGIDVSMETSSTDRNGHVSSSSYRRSGGSKAGSRSSSTYTSRSTTTVVENGRRVTVQSMEKDGNRIEERYEGSKLVGRTINGVREKAGRIDL